MAILERASDGKIHCKCGQTFSHGAWYTKHALRCPVAKGEAPTQSRIAQSIAAATPPSAKRSRKTRQSKRAGSPARAHRTRRSSTKPSESKPTEILSRAAIIRSLRAEAAQIMRAIAAIEEIA